jgi:hypothetical protein
MMQVFAPNLGGVIPPGRRYAVFQNGVLFFAVIQGVLFQRIQCGLVEVQMIWFQEAPQVSSGAIESSVPVVPRARVLEWEEVE